MAKYNGIDFVYTPGKFPAEQIELFDLSDLAYAICHELIRRGGKAEITIEYPKDNLEINKKNGLTEVPEGYRVIEDWELLREMRTNKKLKTLAKREWVYVNTPFGIRTAGFDYDDSDFLVNGYILTNNFPACSRGVFVKLGDEEGMTTKCIEVEYPFDGRRKVTIITNDSFVCEHLAKNPDEKIGIHFITKDNKVLFGTRYEA